MALLVGSHNSLCSGHILLVGSEEQKRRFLPPLARGEKLGAWALTEPGSGRTPAPCGRAPCSRRDRWIIRGDKQFITQGSTAGTYVIMASTDPSQGTRGISAFIVVAKRRDSRSASSRRSLACARRTRRRCTSTTCACRRRTGCSAVNEGFKDVLAVLASARIGMAALAVGIAQGALDEALSYAKRRRQFGKPILEYEAIQWMLADMATEIEAARLMAWHAATLRDQGQPYLRVASQAKLHCVGSGSPLDIESHPDSRRIWLLEGLAGRAVLSRREAVRNRRRHIRGAAHGDCSRAVQVKRTIIANCGGFWGDDPSAPRRQVEGGPIDYLVMDYLAEVTMAILQKQRARNPAAGYPADFISHLRDVLPSCVQRGIRVITNAGGVNPLGCRAAVEALARDLNVADKVKVALVTGDDLYPELDQLLVLGRAARQYGHRPGAVRDSSACAVGERVHRCGRDRQGARARRQRRHHRARS